MPPRKGPSPRLPFRRLQDEAPTRDIAAPKSGQPELSAFLGQPFDPVSSLCQHVWAAVGGRLDREELIALLNALRIPDHEVRAAVSRRWHSFTGKLLAYPQFLELLTSIVSDAKFGDVSERIHMLYGEEDFLLPPPKVNPAMVAIWCFLAPFTWPLFVAQPMRRSALRRELSLAAVLCMELVFVLAFAPIVLLFVYWPELMRDRVSIFECFLPSLAVMLMLVMQASSMGFGWFHLRLSHLHLWRRMRAQERFLQRFERNRILLQRLSVAVYGDRSYNHRTVWAYELLTYLEGGYARPEGLIANVSKAERRPKVAGVRTSADAVNQLLSTAGPVGGIPDAALKTSQIDDPYYDYERPDSLDTVTHTLAISEVPLFSSGWFLARIRQPITFYLVFLAVLSPSVPCLVRHFVHNLPYFGSHSASQIVVTFAALFAVPAVFQVLVILHSFLDMLDFRTRLLRGLNANVRPELASECGVRVQLNLRDPVNLLTWYQVIAYVRKRCLTEEVAPFNALLFPALVLDIALCGMFIWEWIAYHVDPDPVYTINAQDFLGGLTVAWLSQYILVAMSRACDINNALEQHSEEMERTQVELRIAIRELSNSETFNSKELDQLREADHLCTAIVRKTRNVDMLKPFKLLGVPITTARLRALGTMLLAGLISGIWRQIDDVLFTSFGLEF